jgi:cell division septation protein DedD
VKIETPQEPAAADEETVGEAVYGRVAGDAPAAVEQIVEGAEEPREVARIVLPEPQADAEQDVARPVGENEGGTADAGEREDALPGARRVRTYVVRPDGTIVQAETAAVEAAPDAEEQEIAATAMEGEPIQPLPVATTDINAAGEPETASEQPVAPAASMGAASVGSEAPTPVAAAETPESAVEPPASTETAALETPQSAAEVQPDAPAETPVDLLSAAPTQASALATEAPAATGGFVVQLSSQRTQEQALSSFADMKSRYPSVLSEYQPLIQEADLGDQGIYFRVRVGPWGTRAEAIELCESLQAAGADCFVTQ